jgi:nitroreductase
MSANVLLSAYQSRYGKNIADPGFQTDHFIDNVLRRATCRNFKTDPLEPGQLETLLSAAQSSSTSGILQSWSVLILSTPEDKAQLMSLPDFTAIMTGKNKPDPSIDHHNLTVFKTAPVFLIWLADLSRTKLILDGDESFEQDGRIDKAEIHLKAVIDTAIAAQTCSLLAEHMGLGVMYCGSIRHFKYENFARAFNLPKLCLPLFGMALGKPLLDTKHTKPRLEQKFVCHYSTYKKIKYEDLAEYDKIYMAAETSPYSLGPKGKRYFQRVIERTQLGTNNDKVGENLRNAGFTFD